MIKVTFLPVNRSVEFDLAGLPYQGHGKPKSLLDVALNFDIPLEHTCGGNCACTTCHVIVRQGEECLSAVEEEEADRLDLAAGVTFHSRLGCQTVIVKDGEIVVEIPAWNRNYAA